MGVERDSGHWARMIVLAVGYGFYTAWEFVVREPLSFYTDGVWVSMWGPIFLTCSLVFCGLAVVLRMRAHLDLWSAPVGVGAAVAMGLVAALALSSAAGSHVLLAFCSALLTGVCIPLFLCRWARCFLDLGVARALGCMVVAELIAGGVALLASFLDGWALWVIMGAIVAGTNGALWVLGRDVGRGASWGDRGTEVPTAAEASSPHATRAFMALLFVYGVVALLFRVMFSGATQLPLFSIALVSLAVAAALLVPVLLVKAIGADPLRSLLVGLAAILALGYLTGGVFGIDMAGHLFLMGIRAGFICMFMMLVALAARARAAHAEWLGVFAVGWGLLYMGFALGGFLGGVIAPLFPVPNAVLHGGCLVVLGLLAVCLLLAPRVDPLALTGGHGPVMDGAEGGMVTVRQEGVRSAADSLDEACARLGAAYQMTPREIEVFSLLAEGRDTRYIEAALSIARDTVKMHRKSIYRKLDVHSQQELIDLARGDAGR